MQETDSGGKEKWLLSAGLRDLEVRVGALPFATWATPHHHRPALVLSSSQLRRTLFPLENHQVGRKDPSGRVSAKGVALPLPIPSGEGDNVLAQSVSQSTNMSVSIRACQVLGGSHRDE